MPVISPGRLRDLTTEQWALLSSDHYAIHVRVLIENGAGVMVDYSAYLGSDWFYSARWSEDQDRPIASGSLELRRELGGVSLSPLVRASLANRDAAGVYAPAVTSGRRVEIWTAAVPPGVVPAAGDELQVFVGRCDDVDFQGQGSVLGVQFRDLGAWLMETQIKDPKTYLPQGAEEEANGIPVAVLLQRIIDDWPVRGAPQLHVVGDPDWYLARHDQKEDVPVYTALLDIVAQNGWDLRYRFVAGLGSVLVLSEPDRDPNAPADLTMGPDDYVDQSEAKLSDQIMRTDFRLVWVDAGGAPHTTPSRDLVIENTVGNRYIKFAGDAVKNITTQEQADRFLAAVRADLSQPEFSHKVQVRFFPWATLGDRLAYLPNSLQYDEEQRATNQHVEHVLEEGGGWTAIGASSAARGAYAGWINRARTTTVTGLTPLDVPPWEPTIEVRMTDSSAASVTYDVSAAAPNGEQVDLYVAYGADDFPAVPGANPTVVTLARDSADRADQTAHVLALSVSGGSDRQEIVADYSFVPGVRGGAAPDRLLSGGQQVGWTMTRTVDDDARAVRIRVTGDAALVSTVPAYVVVGGSYWVPTDVSKLYTVQLLQGPGADATVEQVPFEFFGPARAAAGSTEAAVDVAGGVSGRALLDRLQRAPVTAHTVEVQGAARRALIFTVNPAGAMLKYRIGANAEVTVGGASVVRVNNIDIAGGDVTVEFYSVSATGVAEAPPNRVTLDANSDPTIYGLSLVESEPNLAIMTFALGDNVLNWRAWRRRGARPVDRSGNPDDLYGWDGADRARQTSSARWAGNGDATSRWYVILRAYDAHGLFTQAEANLLIAGAASPEGSIYNVRGRVNEEPAGSGAFFNDILWSHSVPVAAGGYTVDIYEDGALMASGRDATLDHDAGAVAFEGGWHVRKARALQGDLGANYLTFTYDVVLWHGAVALSTTRAQVEGWYGGDGTYEAPPAAAPAGITLAWDPVIRALQGSWIGVAGYFVDVQWEDSATADFTGKIPYGLARLPRGADSVQFDNPYYGTDGRYYRYQIRFGTNGGVGPWSAWSAPRFVTAPAGSGGTAFV